VTRGAAACEAEVRWRERAVGMMRGRGGQHEVRARQRGKYVIKNKSSIETRPTSFDLDDAKKRICYEKMDVPLEIASLIYFVSDIFCHLSYLFL
jgi:hypothetical protein